MFKRYLFVLTLMVGLLAVTVAGAAQDTLGLLDALEIAQQSASEGALVTEAGYDDDNACWSFEFDDGTEVCISDTTGEVVEPVDDDAADEASDVDDTDEASDVDEADEASDVDETSEASDVDADATPTVSLEDAIAAALEIFPDSTVSSFNLEVNDNGTLVWDIELDDGIRSVDVDATDGAILSFGYEADDNDEDSEASEASQTDQPTEASEDSEASEKSEASEDSESSESSG